MSWLSRWVSKEAMAIRLGQIGIDLMEERSGPPKELGDLEGLIEYIGKPLPSDDFDGLLKIKHFQDRSYQLRTLVDVEGATEPRS